MKRMKERFKKLIAAALAVVMVLGFMPDTFTAEVYAYSESSLKTAYTDTGTYLQNQTRTTAASGSLFGSEWAIIGLTRAGLISKDSNLGKAYFRSVWREVKDNVKEDGRIAANYSSDNARVIIGLSSLGYDPTDIAGRDLVKALNSFKYVSAQGVNGIIWSLVALNTGNYNCVDSKTGIVQGNNDVSDQVSREKLVDVLLNARRSDGGWAYSGNVSDPDITAMTIYALSPFYKTRNDVKTAVDEAVQTLSDIQSSTGGYETNYGNSFNDSSESIDQVIVALTSVGIDPAKDTRFIKNGKTLFDSLLRFAVSGGGFKHQTGETKPNGLATVQSYYALVSYYRFTAGRTWVFDLSDVKDRSNPEYNPALITKISLGSKKTMAKGDKLTLTPTITPEDADNKTLTWTSSNKKIATVNSKGVVTAKKIGTVTITATANDGSGKKATCKITVKNPVKVTGVKLNKSKYTLKKGKSFTLKVTISPKNATNKEVTWSTNKKKVATVKDGKVTAVATGKAKITVTTKDGKKKAYCTVTVK